MISILRELWEFLREHKKLWVVPILLVLLLASTILVITEGSVVAPLLYTLF